jgi:hypothetical protein
MAEFLEEFDFYNMNMPNNTLSMALQMIDLAEKEGFNNIDLSDIQFPDGIIFNRVQRLNKLQKIKITNTNITTLANSPPNIEELIIKKGNICIANFKLVHQLINKITIINNKINKIFHLEVLSNLVFLDLSQNNLEEIPPLPINVLTFIATHNKIKQIINLNSKLVDLNLSNNLISEMCNVPHQIESINISRNMIKLVDLSPFTNLKVFKAYNNKLDLIIGPISSYIEVFDVFNNELEKIPDIGEKIKEIDLSNNDLKVLPKFGTSVLERIDITKNPLLKLSDDEMQMLIDINKINKSIIAMYDQFDFPNKFDSSSSSSSSELDLSDIFDDDDTQTNMKHFDILELLNRNRHRQLGLPHTSPNTFNIVTNQISSIIRGKQIYKRRIYEL